MSLLRRISNLFSRSNVDREIDAELQSHIDMRTEDNLATGMSPQEARREALIRFGNPIATKERVTSADAALLLDSIWADIRYACRQLAKNPGFACTAILVLALGMGASVAIFAFVDAALINPLPYKDPTRLVAVYEASKTCPECNISYQNYLDWKKSDLPFSSLQAWGYSRYLLNNPGGTEPADGTRVSDGFFRTLGVVPILGRDFYPGEDQPGSPRTVLISYAAWQKRFSGDPNVVGKIVTLSDTSYSIIGVLPAGFHFAWRGDAEFWAALNDPDSCDKRRACHSLFGLARLANGASLQTALAALQTVAKQLEMQYPNSNHDLGVTGKTLSEAVLGGIRPILLVLLGGAFLLLLIACVNVAGLLLVRTESRRRETAVRGALGASPTRLLRQFVTEALVLATIGTTLGLGSAGLAIKLLLKLIPASQAEGMPFLLTLGLSPRVLAFAGLISLLAVTMFALTPALRLNLKNLRGDLVEGDRGSAGSGWRRLGSKLIVLELATAVVLLVGAGLLGKSLYKLMRVDVGFVPGHLVSIVVATPKPYAEGDKLAVFERLLTSRIDSLPGVKSSSISSHLPVHAWDGGVPIVLPGHPSTGQRNDIPERDVSSSYLATVGARLVRGRYFTEPEDDDAKPRVVVVNQTLAKQYFPGEDAVGKRLSYEGGKTSMEILGVIDDIKEGPLDSDNRPTIYVPFNQDSYLAFNLVVRTSLAEDSVLPALAAAVHRIDPSLAVSNPTSIAEMIDQSNSAYLHRSSAWLVGGFAGLALLLSVIGLYGVIAYSVSQRTREIGVRMALGAERGTVYRLILKEAGQLTGIGIIAGLLCSIGAAVLMRNLLFGTQAWDVPTLAAVAVVLAVSAMLASYVPARRAASVNPVEALRAE
jgi:macrolide transport system ATP-binding/permease protein